MDAFIPLLDDSSFITIPYPLLHVLAAAGVFFIALKLLSFVRLLLSLFVLPGSSVRPACCCRMTIY